MRQESPAPAATTEAETRNKPASYSLAGLRSCASCDQDRDDEEDKKASEPAGLVAAEVEQHEPDQQGDRHSRSPLGAECSDAAAPAHARCVGTGQPISG